MNIRTKVITTIIAMVCSLTVSASGVVAIMMEFPIAVQNATILELSEVHGDLYGERYGANEQDLVMQHLHKNGEGVQEAEMDFFCQNVSFTPGSRKIEYIFKFILAKDTDSAVLVQLTNGTLSNTATYKSTYLYAYGKEIPDWNTASEMSIGTNYVVSQDSPYLYLRATLEMNPDTIQRIDTSATWSFSYTFTGVAVAD